MRYICPDIKDLSSTDWDGVGPLDDNYDSIPVHIEIGEIDSDGADLFQIEVFYKRPKSIISENIDNEIWLSGRAKLYLRDISMKRIRDVIQDKINILGPFETWPIFAHRLSPYLIWEYEGMAYPPSL